MTSNPRPRSLAITASPVLSGARSAGVWSSEYGSAGTARSPRSHLWKDRSDESAPYQTQEVPWEWVNDWWASDYYSASPKENPQGPTDGIYRVIRGSSFLSDGDGIRVA